MPKNDTEDIVDIKNRKKRRKRLIKFLIFILVIGLGTGLYFTRDKWYNKLRGIGEQYRTIVNSGTLAKGNFPIEVSSDNNYQLMKMGRRIVVLSGNDTLFFDTEGNLLKKRQHTYTNSVLCVSGERALIYACGGNQLSVEDENEVCYTKEFDENILFARLSPEGYTGVVTTAENNKCEIHVYDKKGTIVYDRKCIDEYVNDLSFTNESQGCVFSYIMAKNGQLVTNIKSVMFSDANELWTSGDIFTVGIELDGFNGNAFILGNDSCGYVDSNGNVGEFYQYDGEMKGGSCSGGKAAVIINNEDLRKYIAVLFSDVSTSPLTIELDEPTVDVMVSGGLAYVLTQEHMMAYDFDGGLRSTADVSDSYTGFVKNEEHIFLKSYKKIDRIDFES